MDSLLTQIFAKLSLSLPKKEPFQRKSFSEIFIILMNKNWLGVEHVKFTFLDVRIEKVDKILGERAPN